jgi:hypothetical protein
MVHHEEHMAATPEDEVAVDKELDMAAVRSGGHRTSSRRLFEVASQ